ncbi:MAG TPA: hypothetical protein VG821_07045 [Rhizomicrobium sp.]|jgi:hypothetical protein|nr:hypothetical protein [Rhizomicrobium sp.]
MEDIVESGHFNIGLGSLVVQKSGDGPVMVVAAATGDDMFCVSLDLASPLKLWCHRAMLKRAERPVSRAA